MKLLLAIVTLLAIAGWLPKVTVTNKVNYINLTPNQQVLNKLTNEIKLCESKWQTKCGIGLTKSSDGIVYYDVNTTNMVDKSIQLYGNK